MLRTDGSDGGPAFPQKEPLTNDWPGMSLRDWFAGQALPQAVLDYGEPSVNSSSWQRKNLGNPVLPYSTKAIGTREQIIARQAYAYADAMLEARKQ